MKTISVTNDIAPISKFKASISKFFKNLKNINHPLIITQYGKPVGVLLSPEAYDELVYNGSFLESIGRGISDAESSNTYRSEEVRTRLRSSIKLKAL
jgi:prevent-host-death family protein